MSEEIRVSIQPDQGIKNQWARGLFYRSDGRKNTLVSKSFLGVGLALFVLMSVTLLLQGSPDTPSHSQKSENKSSLVGVYASTSESAKVENIPTIGNYEASQQQHPVSSGSTGRNTNGKKEKTHAFTGPQLVNRPNSGKIPPGSMVKAMLLTGASNGLVRAEVKEALTINGETLIEEGALLLGTGSSGEDRLSIRFTQMVFKDGAFNTIDAQACDGDDKIVGLKGSKIGNQAVKLAMGIGLNFAGGMTTALQDTQGEYGAVVTKPTLKNALLNGAATASLDQSREIMSDVRNKPLVFEVAQGTSIYVLFQGN